MPENERAQCDEYFDIIFSYDLLNFKRKPIMFRLRETIRSLLNGNQNNDASIPCEENNSLLPIVTDFHVQPLNLEPGESI